MKGVQKVKIKLSKFGICFVLIFLAIIPLAVIMIPLSMGYSILWITVISFPWNHLISKSSHFLYSNWDAETVIPGILINIIVLYVLGFIVEKLLVKTKKSNPLP